MTLESITAYWKRAPEGSCLSQQRRRGNLWLLQEPAAGSSCGWSSKENYQPRPMSLFFTITPLFGTIASWGFGVNFHHFEPEINLVGEKLWNKCNNQTRIATKLGLSLCTVTNVHRHCFELFCPYEELSFLFFPFFPFLLLFPVETKHAAYLVYAVHVTLEGEETDEQKMPALLTARAQAGMTESASTWQQRPPFSPLLFFLPASSIIIYFIVYDTQERQRPGAITKLCIRVVEKLAFSSTVCVFGNRWINK